MSLLDGARVRNSSLWGLRRIGFELGSLVGGKGHYLNRSVEFETSLLKLIDET
jgi:hypothetical protein